MAMEKSQLPEYSNISSPPGESEKGTVFSWKRILALICAAFFIRALLISPCSRHPQGLSSAKPKEPQCPQSNALYPATPHNADIHQKLISHYKTDEFLLEAVESISGAVQVPTESYDNLKPVGEDPRWDVFADFHEFLEGRFASVYETLEVTKINTYGLVFVWQGSNPDLKPIVLVAHQDVVPVDPKTVDQWMYPPYSGHYDGEYVWGRGSNDDKSGLIGVLSAVDNLIKHGFKPTRSIFLTFGMDEECGGDYGAIKIVEYLVAKYGKNHFSLVIDEGGGFGSKYNKTIAFPDVGEKGILDMHVTVETPGGHSSVPPPHTSIGILAQVITTLEANPFEPILTRTSPMWDTVQCLMEHTPDELSGKLKSALRKGKLEGATGLLVREKPELLPLLRTTLAVDMIQGGVKANALPEGATAVVDQRISIDSSLAQVQAYHTHLLSPLAEKFNLTFTSFGQGILPTSSNPSSNAEAKPRDPKRKLTISDAWGTSFDPLQKAPTFGSEAWDVLAGSIVSSYRAFRPPALGANGSSGVDYDEGYKGEAEAEILVFPSMSTGNTDVRFYEDISQNIYRYNHGSDGKGGADPDSEPGRIHTVNERLHARSFVEQIAFFTTLILNADESGMA